MEVTAINRSAGSRLMINKRSQVTASKALAPLRGFLLRDVLSLALFLSN